MELNSGRTKKPGFSAGLFCLLGYKFVPPSQPLLDLSGGHPQRLFEVRALVDQLAYLVSTNTSPAPDDGPRAPEGLSPEDNVEPVAVQLRVDAVEAKSTHVITIAQLFSGVKTSKSFKPDQCIFKSGYVLFK